jgi:hypothetical protein
VRDYEYSPTFQNRGEVTVMPCWFISQLSWCLLSMIFYRYLLPDGASAAGTRIVFTPGCCGFDNNAVLGLQASLVVELEGVIMRLAKPTPCGCNHCLAVPWQPLDACANVRDCPRRAFTQCATVHVGWRRAALRNCLSIGKIPPIFSPLSHRHA